MHARRQIAEAVAYLHSLNIMHRDLARAPHAPRSPALQLAACAPISRLSRLNRLSEPPPLPLSRPH